MLYTWVNPTEITPVCSSQNEECWRNSNSFSLVDDDLDDPLGTITLGIFLQVSSSFVILPQTHTVRRSSPLFDTEDADYGHEALLQTPKRRGFTIPVLPPMLPNAIPLMMGSSLERSSISPVYSAIMTFWMRRNITIPVLRYCSRAFLRLLSPVILKGYDNDEHDQ
jgi:hypothetical protein